MLVTRFELKLPAWLQTIAAGDLQVPASLRHRMQFVLDLTRQNVEQSTGGPFGAAVFDEQSGAVVSVGVNLVVSSGLSIAHAEVVALSLAQQAIGRFDLSTRPYQLVTSAEPCWMCLGAIHWAGIRSVVCGARDSDVRAIGFDEGHKPVDWAAEYTARGVNVIQDIERDAAAEVLRSYLQQGGAIYNAGNRDSHLPQ